jgi:hypothetical protein
MPTRYIPMSEDEQKFAALLDQIFTDQNFAKAMQTDPAKALSRAGYELTAAQAERLRRAKLSETPDLGGDTMAFPLTRPLVSVLTKGTKPVVRVVTKGTQPAVQVAVNTVIAVQESKAPELTLHEVTEGPRKPRKG